MSSYREDMLITEELFLLLTTDEGKTEGWGTQKGYGLAGAVLADLIVAERISFGAEKDPRVSVISLEPTGNRVLDAALVRVAEKDGKKASSLVQDRKLNPEAHVAAALAARGIIAIEEKQLLGLVPARYPVLDSTPEREVRERLRVVLAGGTPTEHEATLLSILQGLEVAHKVLAAESGGLSKRELKVRIKQISDDLPGSAVAKAVQNLNTAVMVAIVPAIAASSTS